MRLRLATGVAVGIMGSLTGALLFFMLTGCSSGGATPGTSASPAGAAQTQSLQQQARAVWLDYARCVRSHGFPDFPDPVVDSQGQPHFPSSPQIKSISQREQGACRYILSRLPAAARGQTPVTPAELHQEVLFAGCMRQHGLARSSA